MLRVDQRSLVAVLLVTILAGACGGSASDPPDVAADGNVESSVAVTLGDYSVEAQPDSVPAGEVVFDVTNESGGHDLYVLKTELPSADIPQHKEALRPDVKALKPNLEAPGVEVVGSIEPLEEGRSDSLTLELEPGHYVLICNLIDFKETDGKIKVLDSHYAQGMRTDFSVR